MMKPIVIILLLLGCTFSAFAADKVTPEFNNLQVIRAKKIQEIDTAYVKALEKLKLKCMKKGDLVSANAINDELTRLNSNPVNIEKSADLSITSDNAGYADVYCKAPTSRFKSGSYIYEGGGGSLGEVPEKYDGMKISLNNKKPADPLVFKIKKAGLVRLVCANPLSPKMTAQGWEVVGLSSINGGSTKITILESFLAEGEYSFNEGVNNVFGLRLLSE